MCVGSVCTHPSYNDKNEHRAHEHLKENATKRLALTRADFDRFKKVFVYAAIEKF